MSTIAQIAGTKTTLVFRVALCVLTLRRRMREEEEEEKDEEKRGKEED